ncbi:MAG: TRAM domain-containing protein [Methanophagales archaeon ANME-1-THS]|nr:MAG: TRAM domain-containing protein [Methanophagales archaeon ANME-1-THS]
MENRERRGFSSPIEVGETYDVAIEDVGREGDGITHIEGFVVFGSCPNYAESYI